MLWDTGHHKLSLPLLIDPGDEHHVRALCRPTCFVRILRRVVRGRERYFTQLVCAGLPLAREIGEGVVSLDVGPSTVAIVTAGHAPRLERLAPSAGGDARERRRYQRRLDRQRRASNPANFNADGTIKARRERQPWQDSRCQRCTRGQVAETQRRLARRNEHGGLANQIVQAGVDVRAEKLSYRAFQRCYGRSVGVRAPGAFVALVKRKGRLTEIPTHSTFLSQRCLCGKRVKKDLSLRWHTCDCEHLQGRVVQRDQFSAFLALFCDEHGAFDQAAAVAAWQEWGANCLPRPTSRERVSIAGATREGQSASAEKRHRTRGDGPPLKLAAGKASGRARSTHRPKVRGPHALAA